MELFLCSASKRRIDLLNQHNIPFTKIRNKLTIEPTKEKDEHPIDYVVRCATQKVLASKGDYRGLIVGVDTIIAYKGKVYGKPLTLDHATHTLNELAGKTHQVITACAIFNTQYDEWQFCIDYARVTFKSNQTEVMRQYVMDYSPLDKAGAYGIQDDPLFIDRMEGDIETVIGLPIKRLLKIFSTYAIV